MTALNIKTIEVSDKAVNAGTSIWPAIKFIAWACLIAFAMSKISDRLQASEYAKSILVVLGVFSYAFIAVMSMSKYEMKARAKKMQSEIMQENDRLAKDIERTKADYDRLIKDIERLKADNDRCWQSERALKERLSTVQASATTVFEEAEKQKQQLQKEYVLQLNDIKTEYFKLEKQFEALKEAVRMEGELGTLNGRSAKATTDEKEQIERQKQELRLNLAKHLQSNAFLQSLKPAWSIAK